MTHSTNSSSTFIGYYCVPDIRPGAKHTDSVSAYKGIPEPVTIYSYKTPIICKSLGMSAKVFKCLQ